MIFSLALIFYFIFGKNGKPMCYGIKKSSIDSGNKQRKSPIEFLHGIFINAFPALAFFRAQQE
jgi:hypothetical protein